MCLVSVVCCQVEISETGRSLFQRSPICCGVSEYDFEISTMRSSRPPRAVAPQKEITLMYNLAYYVTVFGGRISEPENRKKVPHLLRSPVISRCRYMHCIVVRSSEQRNVFLYAC
jgi:hypothetical protein